jgi:hypothetical protein
MKKKTPTIIMHQDSRILTPLDWEILRDNLNPYYRVFCEGALLSGLRPTELRRYAENPHWRQADKIVLPDIPSKQVARVVNLSNEGRYAMEVFDVTVRNSGIRERPNVHKALGSAAIRANGDFIPVGINESMFRETWITWLVTSLPESRHADIFLSMSCQPGDYLGLPFSKKDIVKMKKYTEGW